MRGMFWSDQALSSSHQSSAGLGEGLCSQKSVRIHIVYLQERFSSCQHTQLLTGIT